MQHKIAQNTESWMQLRSGKFTASSFKDLFASKSTATYKKALYKVVYERMTGEQPESFKSEYMERGNQLEPLARSEYEMQTFNTVEDGGFFELNDFIGASPDGLIGDDGLLEIKCPAYNTMIQYLIDRKLPNQYKYQVHGQLYVTGRKWTDFCAYHPKLPIIIIRVKRDEVIINEIKNKLIESIDSVKRIINQINNATTN